MTGAGGRRAFGADCRVLREVMGLGKAFAGLGDPAGKTGPGCERFGVRRSRENRLVSGGD